MNFKIQFKIFFSFFFFEKSEKNNKKLSELCSEFITAQNEWKGQLTNEALRIDPNKEMVTKKDAIHF